MNNERQETPFKPLGDRLKTIRQKLHESMAEVSGAVEIDVPMLERIEQGRERPSEDILLLLINHFGVHDDDAASLWKLAGYEDPKNADDRDSPRDDQQNRAGVLVLAIDPRIMYSDGVQVHASPSGVIVNFAQGAGTPQMLTTARIGMSRDQAERVVFALQEALTRSSPRQLPSGEDV